MNKWNKFYHCPHCHGLGYENYPRLPGIPCRVLGHKEIHDRTIMAIHDSLQRNPEPSPRETIIEYWMRKT